MPELLKGYAIVSLCGWAVSPAVRRMLSALPDGGHSACRCFGWVLAAWLSWMMVWASGRPLTTPMALGSIALIAALTRVPRFLRRRGVDAGGDPAHGSIRHGRYRALVVCGEILFFTGLLLFFAIQARNPAVDPDSERFMDYAFLRASLRAPGLPLMDPWLAGEKAAYYHFAYALVAFLVRACGTDPASFFTTAIALPYALLWLGAFGAGAALTGRVRGGAIAAILLLGAGNFEWLRHAGRSLREASFDWFSPSRAIEGAITEFPWFSLLWGDLHPYVLVLPILVCAITFVLSGVLEAARDATMTGSMHSHDAWIPAARAAALALLGGAALSAHPWDYPLLFGTAAVLIALAPGPGRFTRLGALTAAGALAWPLYLPFLEGLAFGGRRIAPAPAATAPSEWLLAYGPFVLLLILAAPFLPGARRAAAAPGPPGAGPAALALGVCAAFTAIAPELIYVPDLFASTPLARMNTVFKLYRYAWLLLALLSAFVIESLLPARPGPAERGVSSAAGRRANRAVLAGLAMVAGAALVYPVCGTASWLRAARAHRDGDGADRASVRQGAGAESALDALMPGDAAAAAFLARSAGPHDALLEETGDPYTWSSRVSTFSGVPAVLGWGNHEAVWRGGWDEIVRRSADVAEMYRHPGARRTCELLRGYGVKWIVAGERERLRYGTTVAELGRLAGPVFTEDGTELFATDDVCAKVPR